MATTKINATQIAGTAGSPTNGEVVKLDATGSTGHSGSLNAITASYFKGDGSALTNISSDSVDVTDSSANTEFRLVGVATSGDPATLTCMDTAAQRVTMNAQTGKVTIAADLTVGDDVSLASDASVFSMGDGSDVTFTHDGTSGLTIAATPISINSTGDLTLDSSADVIFDAAGNDFIFKDGGTAQLKINNATAGDIDITLLVDGDDLVFNQFDGTEVLRLTDGGSVEVKDDMTLKSDAAVLGFGADTDVTLTHVADTGILLNSTMAIQFNDSSQYIKASSAADLDLAATTDINLDCTTVDVNGALDVSGASTLGGTTGVVVSAAGAVAVNNGTDSTAATNGSLQTDGGLGVVKDASFGNDVMLISDAAVLNFGADSDVKLTHVADTGILLNSTMAIQFNDSSQYIKASSAADLDLAATTDINMDCTTVDINGALDVSGVSTLLGAVTFGAAPRSDTTNTDALGTTSVTWSDLYLGDSSVLAFGEDQDVTLTHVPDTGILLNSTMAIQFSDSSQYIHAPDAANLTIAATTDINLDCTTVDVNGILDVSGASTLAGAITPSGAGDGTFDISADSVYFRDSDGTMKRDAWGDILSAAVDGSNTNGVHTNGGQLMLSWGRDTFTSASILAGGGADDVLINTTMSLGSRPVNGPGGAGKLGQGAAVYFNGQLLRSGSHPDAYDYFFSAHSTLNLLRAVDADDVVEVLYLAR